MARNRVCWRAAHWGALLPALLAVWAGCSHREADGVVVYTAQDQVYAEPIFQEFTRKTGIPVRAVFDSEAVKTVGLANRLLAEKDHPQCDVFWGNEELRARQLAMRGVFQETPGLATFGYRTRRLVVNTNLVSAANQPTSLLDLTNAAWRGKVALAYPLFGTTATHFLALRQLWGTEGWEAWCRALQASQSKLVDGNSLVVQLVGRGEAAIGLTDADDIEAGKREGLPIAAVPWNSETLFIPNAVGIIAGAPHPSPARQLYRFLQQPETVARLVSTQALEGGSQTQHVALRVEWPQLLQNLETATDQMRAIFLR